MSDGSQHNIFEKVDYILFLLKIFQEVNLGVVWNQNEEKDILEVYCM